MLITNLKLKNWRNFTRVDVALQKRQFIIGSNASGKSNLLDVFRFLRDIAKQRGGGLQEAIASRGGMSKLRCLSARQEPEIIIGVSISEPGNTTDPKWRYEIGIGQEAGGKRKPQVSYEKVWNAAGEVMLDRPNDDDRADKVRLSQTYLEQVNNNRYFRDIQEYFEKISYLHLVPQLLRHADEIQGRVMESDPFGQGLLDSMANTPKRTREFRLRKVSEIVKIAVPRMSEVNFEQTGGKSHITARYSHWRRGKARQAEDQFSDGTLRLVGLTWSLLAGESLLLLEEPELSLHPEIVKNLAALFYKAQRSTKKARQVLISTHSADLLTDGVGGEEVLVLTPTDEGTKVEVASNLPDVNALLIAGASVGEAVIPHTRPENVEQMSLFDFS